MRSLRSEGRWNTWRNRELKIIHFAGLPENTGLTYSPFSKEKTNAKDLSGSWEGLSLPRDAKAFGFKVLFQQGVCFVRRWCSALWLLQQSVGADACSISAPSPGRACLLPQATDKMLQWQQKSGQVKHMPFWSGRKALVIPICSLWTSKVSRVIISLLLKLVTEQKKVGLQQRSKESRQEKPEN